MRSKLEASIARIRDLIFGLTRDGGTVHSWVCRVLVLMLTNNSAQEVNRMGMAKLGSEDCNAADRGPAADRFAMSLQAF